MGSYDQNDYRASLVCQRTFRLPWTPWGSEPYPLFTQTERNLESQDWELKLNALPAMLCHVFSPQPASPGKRPRAPDLPLLMDTSKTSTHVTGSKEAIPLLNQISQFASKAGPSLLSPFPSFRSGHGLTRQ